MAMRRNHDTMNDSGVTPAFISKLWSLVEDKSTDHLIAWDSEGKSFHVFDQMQLAKEVLPLYFKHSNIASFIRQLNMYGFRKVAQTDHGSLKVEADDMEFQHPLFVRGKEYLITQIKRKHSASTTSKENESKIAKDDVNKVLSDIKSLKAAQANMDSQLTAIKKENGTLWREVVSLRHKHSQQQQIVNKLIQFLVTLVQKKPNINNPNRRRALMLHDSAGGSRPAKVPRQYIDESGSTYSVDLPDSPSTVAMAESLGRAAGIYPASNSGGVQIQEVYDPLPTATADLLSSAPGGSAGFVAGSSSGVPSARSPDSVSTTSLSPRALEEFLLPNTASSTDIASNMVYATAVTSPEPATYTFTQSVPQPPSYVNIVSGDQMSKQKPTRKLQAKSPLKPLKIIKVIPRTSNSSQQSVVSNVLPQATAQLGGNPVTVQSAAGAPTLTSNQPYMIKTDLNPGLSELNHDAADVNMMTTTMQPLYVDTKAAGDQMMLGGDVQSKEEAPDVKPSLLSRMGGGDYNSMAANVSMGNNVNQSENAADVTSTSLALLPEANNWRAASSSYATQPSPKRVELNENLDNIDADLESLKELLASGQYNLDAETLLGLFNPEGPVPQTPEHLLNLIEHPLRGLDNSNKDDNAVSGNEVVQYVQPTEDMGDIFDLDASPTSLLSPGLVPLPNESDNIFPDLDSDLMTPHPLGAANFDVKVDSPPMEEID